MLATASHLQFPARPNTGSPIVQQSPRVHKLTQEESLTFGHSVLMDPYLGTYTVQRQRNAPSQPAAIVSSFPTFPASYRRAGPWIYSANLNLLPNASATTTIITAQMDPQPNRSWTNAASIGVEHPGLPLPSPQQASFAEYWRHINSQPNSNSRIHYGRRHSSSTGSALSSGSGANGITTTNGHNTSLAIPTSSSNPISLSMASSIIPPHHATGRFLLPQLHLNTAGLEQGQGHGHGVPTFLSPPHHMNFSSPSADTRPSNGNGETIWPNSNSNEHNSSPVESMPTRTMVLARSHHATGGGGAPGSIPAPLHTLPLPLWHALPRLGPPLPSFPRWNHHQLTSSTWIPQMSPADSVSVPQPHAQPLYMRQQQSAQSTSSIMPPPSIQHQHNPSHFPLHRHHHHHQNPHSHPHPHPPTTTSSEIPHSAAGAGTGYAYQARVLADTNPTPPPPPPARGSTSTIVSVSRPVISVRRRSSLSVSVSASATNLVKRKPLPKIYGCEGCGKKFDRPSTLKVHEAIHTGAKDHLCEYCIRAFTVQSNMKRHMRVCKHKPLSPPMSLCFIISATPAAPFPTRTAAPSFQTPFQGISSFGVSLVPLMSNSQTSALPAMQHIDRSSSLMLSGSSSSGGASSSSTTIHPSISAAASTSTRQTPMIETASGTVPMIAFEHPQYLDDPHSPTHHGPPPTVKGYRAPMIIAAMFSVQQNVPASVAKFTLVHLECDIPLPPVTPHPEYIGLYPDANGFTAKIIEQPEPKGEPFSYPNLPPARYSQSSFASSSTSLPSTLHTVETVSSAATEVHPRNNEDRNGTPPLEFYVDPNLRTKDTSPLPDIRFEERNSFYPRSRYCYHPAEWDPIGLLPGPGIVDLPEEAAEFAANP